MARSQVFARILLAGGWVAASGCNCGHSAPSPDAGACDPGSGPGTWTWMGGSQSADQPGVYEGGPTPSSPGGRDSAAAWVDSNGDFWLFGGYGNGDRGSGYLDDLWKFDGTRWTWVGGATGTNQEPRYGGDAALDPGGRSAAATWVDRQGTLWLFGGRGYFGESQGLFGDLWTYDGTRWTWVSGPQGTDVPAEYGALGVANEANQPGGRAYAATWTDGSGNFWLFGGRGPNGDLNDVWRFDGATWTWMGGSTEPSQVGQFGEQGVADAGNLPGGLEGATTWSIAGASGGDAFWLFGGSSTGSQGFLADLWKYDGQGWSWVHGTGSDDYGVYGSLGVAGADNHPGARHQAVSWSGRCGSLWLATGYGVSEGSEGPDVFSDVWRFDGAEWTWVSGASASGRSAVYGTLGVSDAEADGGANVVIGARAAAARWLGSDGAVWIFGGWGPDAEGVYGELNDLWRYQP